MHVLGNVGSRRWSVFWVVGIGIHGYMNDPTSLDSTNPSLDAGS
jgi:hypothetical protein